METQLSPELYITRINNIIEKIDKIERAMNIYINDTTEEAWEAYKALLDKRDRLIETKEGEIRFLYYNYKIIF